MVSSVILSQVLPLRGARMLPAQCSLLSVSLLLCQNLEFSMLNGTTRSYDIHERTGRVPHGPVLWQLWHHGYLQLERDRTIGSKGSGFLERTGTYEQGHDASVEAGGPKYTIP
jgi:hypothetical protein